MMKRRTSDTDPSLLDTGTKILFEAVTHGKVKTVSKVLDSVSADKKAKILSYCDMRGRSALMLACLQKSGSTRLQLIRILLHHGALINWRDDTGRTTLHYAAENGYLESLLELLNHQPYIQPDLTDRDGLTPLMAAAKIGNEACCKLFMRFLPRRMGGIEVDKLSSDGWTALLLAAQKGNTHCCKILLHDGGSDLDMVIGETNKTVREYLVDYGYELTQDVRGKWIIEEGSGLQQSKETKRHGRWRACRAGVRIPMLLRKVSQDRETQMPDRRERRQSYPQAADWNDINEVVSLSPSVSAVNKGF